MDFISFPKLGITVNVSKGFSIGAVNVRWYGVIICAGLLLCIFLGLRFAKKYALDPDRIIDYVLVAVPSAIIFARIYYVVFEWDQYKNDFAEVFKIWNGGLAIYGGIIGAFLAVFIMSRIRKDSFVHLTDYAFPYIALGQAIGRWGNFTNQEAFGGTTNLPWGMTGSEIGSTPVHPTFLYESLWCFIVFAFLVIYRKKLQKNFGEITSLYMILYGIERAIVEGLRTDSLWINIGSLSLRVSQWLSIFLVVIGIALFIDFRLKGKNVAAVICPREEGAEIAPAEDEPAEAEEADKTEETEKTEE